MLNGLLEHLRRIFSTRERPAYARQKTVRFILNLTIPTGSVFSLLNYRSGHYKLALIEILVMFFVLAPVYWLVKKEGRIGLSETIVMLAAVIIFGTMLVTGGKGGAGSNWMFVIPFVAFYMNNQQTAWKWIGAFYLFMLAHLIGAREGYITPFYTIEQIRIFLVAFLFYTLIAYMFSSARNHYDSKLEAQVRRQTSQLRGNMQELKQQALFDSLTRLPNRYLFEERLAQAINTSEKEKSSLCVAVIDLDRFQDVNNIMGHDKGDEVLRKMGARIAGLIHPSDTLARVGGDTFALILPQTDQKTIHGITQKIFMSMEEPFEIHGYEIDLSVNIGVALAPLHGIQPSILLQRADLAMRQGKMDQMGRAVIYNQQEDTYSFRNLVLFGKLRKAIANGDLSLVYQPKIDLKTLRIAGVEALIRWHDAEEGLIPPEKFIPMAEQTGIINKISEWVLEEAVQQAAAWHKAGYSIPVAINLSPRDLLNTALANKAEALLAMHGLSYCDICIEVTETALMTHPDRALVSLTALRDIGISLSIDDFGTGYSSLAYLKNLPLSELKIDQCFVFSMLTNEADMMIVKSTVDLAHGLGLTVVAEGVEETEVLQALKDMGVDKAQGYLMAHPLTPSDFQKWLVESEWGLESPLSGPGEQEPPQESRT